VKNKTRPDLERVRAVAFDVINNPRQRPPALVFPELVQASERLATRKAAFIEAENTAKRLRLERSEMVAAAVELLKSQIVTPLYGAIRSNAPGSEIVNGEIQLGQAGLFVDALAFPIIKLRQDGRWDDIVTVSQIIIF
jgi:hypothetical protein